MKKIKSLVALAALVMIFSTCDENDPGVNDQDEEKPEPTMVGFPNGLPVSKTIGSAGGVVSIEGKVEVEIPAGALSADTEISIQPIINNAPNGNGNAYRLGPDGVNFSKPVKLTFPYTPVADGPALTGIAFQDKDGLWYSTGKFSWDEVNETVSTETDHFSDWATFDVLQITCDACKATVGGYELKVDESGDFKLYAMSSEALDNDLLQPLRPNNYAYDKIIKKWFANGHKADRMTDDGLITPSERGCTYTAPAKVPQGNPVNLSVTLQDLLYKDPRTGATFSNLQVATSVKILGDFKYDLVVRYYSDNVITGGLVGTAFIMKDSATARVVTKGDGSIVCSDIKNSPGVVIPTSKLDPTGNKSTCTSDVFLGPINVTECSGVWSEDTDGKRVIQFIVTGNSETPAFDWVGALGGKVSFPKGTGGLMQIFVFDVTGDIPIWMNKNDVMTAKLILIE